MPRLLLEGAINGRVGKKSWSFETGNIGQSEGCFPKLKPFIDEIVKDIDKWLSTAGDKRGQVSLGLTVRLEAKIQAEVKVF